MYEELIRRLREEPLDSNKAALPIMDLDGFGGLTDNEAIRIYGKAACNASSAD